MEKFKDYIIRSFIWNSIFILSCIFAMLYLVRLEEIKNGNMFFVFFPILIIAISSETMTRKKELCSQRVKPISLIDFFIKIIVFILSQIAYRRNQTDKFFILLLILVILLGIGSYICEIIMLKKISRKNS